MCDHGDGHDHGHGGSGDGHDHSSCANESVGESFSLWQYIDTDGVTCLNEADPGSIKGVFKTWDKRLDRTKFVDSDCDEELIITIPFTGMVKLRSFCIIGGPEGSSPLKMKMYLNQEGLDFDSAAVRTPVQEFDLAQNLDGEIEQPVQSYGWGDVSSISMYICSNWGADQTRIYYIGLKGSFFPVQRKAVVANYEVAPIPDKSKLSELQGQHSVF